MKEADIMRQIQLAVTAEGARAFRNNVGQVEDITGRVIRFGLCPGSSDLIGWVPRIVTPDMVGRRVATFLAIEVKRPGGRATDQQLQFIEAVVNAGGIAAIACAPDQVKEILR